MNGQREVLAERRLIAEGEQEEMLQVLGIEAQPQCSDFLLEFLSFVPVCQKCEY